MKKSLYLLFASLMLLNWSLVGQSIKLKSDRIFDGEQMLTDQCVTVEDGLITATGPCRNTTGVEVIDLGDVTLMPGIIEGHSHVLLHPYNETSWNDQVLKESYGERAARAVNHVRWSLEAGVTTMRDLGSEGAGYLDVGIKASIDKGVIPGPDLIVAGPAIVATGSYGPKGFHDGVTVPLGAEEADAPTLIPTVRRQIGNGADFIKVYADYRWGPNGDAQPTFSQQEIATIVATAASSGRVTVAHAATSEGIQRAVNAGVSTIEHGDGATRDDLQLMKSKGVALFPTLAAVESISSYRGWNKGKDKEPLRITTKKKVFEEAMSVGVIIGFGGDVGVYNHGNNVLELELMVEYGMSNLQALKAATSTNAQIMNLSNKGSLKEGFLADIIAVSGDPSKNISDLRKVVFVMKDGAVFLRKE